MTFHKATSEYPDSFDNQEVKDFLAKYYDISNNPAAHDEYVEFFTKDATFVIGSQRAEGSESKPTDDHRRQIEL